jgi:hypothetical protein
MSENKYLKCACQKCSASIEFPVHGIGSAVPCPHCGENTTLFAPPAGVCPAVPSPPHAVDSAHLRPAPVNVAEEPPTDSPASALSHSRNFPPTAIALLAVFLALTGSTLFVFRGKFSASKSGTSDGPASTETPPASGAEISQSAQAGASTPAAKRPKSIDDLKIGAITLEKAKGSSLVYAVGVVRNESDHQRFGVNLELELADATGVRAGVAKDYRSVIEPRQEWRFRALVLDTKAVSAKLSKIREEE